MICIEILLKISILLSYYNYNIYIADFQKHGNNHKFLLKNCFIPDKWSGPDTDAE